MNLNSTNGVPGKATAARPHITWAHEVGGWWRLELNGKTVSEHKQEADFKIARDRLIAALGVLGKDGGADA